MLQGTLVVDCQAPSSSLAMSLLRLHSDHQTCGHVILRLVQLLSLRLKATISDIAVDHSLLVQSVISLYLYVCLSSCIQRHGSVFQTWAELYSNLGFWILGFENAKPSFGIWVLGICCHSLPWTVLLSCSNSFVIVQHLTQLMLEFESKRLNYLLS